MKARNISMYHRGSSGLLRAVCLMAVTSYSSLLAQQPGPSVPANVEEINLQRRPMPAGGALNQSFTTAAPEDFSKAQLEPGALLSMQVFGVPEMSNVSLRVDDKGEVFVPTVGAVHVGDLTVPQAQQAIAAAFVKAEVLIAPVLQLSVVQFAANFISVLGEVQSPGRFQMIGPRNLAEVLALAGGETLSAGNDIEVQRGNRSAAGRVEHIRYTPHDSLDKLRSTVIQPGDNVYVRRAGVVYVLGAVNRPGGYVMVNGGLLNIFQALSLAGGTTLDAAKNGMYIVRPHDEVFETIKVPFSKLAKDHQAQIALQQNDVLYIPRSGVRVTLLDGSAIIGAAVNGAMYAAR